MNVTVSEMAYDDPAEVPVFRIRHLMRRVVVQHITSTLM
jgi:hypothetical protein